VCVYIYIYIYIYNFIKGSFVIKGNIEFLII
jgi:hypothetical protein